MNLQRPDLNHKPGYSKSRSIRRGGALNVTSTHEVFNWPLLHYYFRMAIIESIVGHLMEMNWVVNINGLLVIIYDGHIMKW